MIRSSPPREFSPPIVPVLPSPFDPPGFHEPFVMAHQHVGFDLPHRVQGHADHDQERRPAEIKRHIELRDQNRGKHADRGDINGAAEGDPGQNPVDEFGGLLPGRIPGM